MPSPEFMQRVLSTGRNEDPVPNEFEAELEEPELEEEEPLEEAEPDSEVTEEPEEEGEGEPEDEQADEPEEETSDEEAETPEAAQEEEFYLGTYRTKEEAERGLLEGQQHISRLAEEMHQMRERQAQYEGYMQALAQQQQQAPQGDFDEWAEAFISQGPQAAWAGGNEALQASLAEGDSSYVDAYVEQWKDVDPFEAARYRMWVDTQSMVAAQAADEANQPPPVQTVINHVWEQFAQGDPEFGADAELREGTGKILLGTPGLKALALSGDPELAHEAIRLARDGYRMRAGTGNGTPRKVKSSDAERLKEEKLAATVTTGDSSPERGRGSTPEVPAELQEMVQRISAGEGGFPRLRE